MEQEQEEIQSKIKIKIKVQKSKSQAEELIVETATKNLTKSQPSRHI